MIVVRPARLDNGVKHSICWNFSGLKPVGIGHPLFEFILTNTEEEFFALVRKSQLKRSLRRFFRKYNKDYYLVQVFIQPDSQQTGNYVLVEPVTNKKPWPNPLAWVRKVGSPYYWSVTNWFHHLRFRLNWWIIMKRVKVNRNKTKRNMMIGLAGFGLVLVLIFATWAVSDYFNTNHTASKTADLASLQKVAQERDDVKQALSAVTNDLATSKKQLDQKTAEVGDLQAKLSAATQKSADDQKLLTDNDVIAKLQSELAELRAQASIDTIKIAALQASYSTILTRPNQTHQTQEPKQVVVSPDKTIRIEAQPEFIIIGTVEIPQ